jgi:sugar/nucleoside kinase (ribokinase family)
MRRNSIVPKVYGTGLISLDVVYGLQKRTPKYQVGGTCGNVLSILGFLGWDSYPISRLDTDCAGNIVRSDFAQCGVHSDYLGLAPTAATPIIIEQIAKTKQGRYTHRFQLACPSCGRFFPSFKPLRHAMVSEFLAEAGTPNVFFADRVSKGILALAAEFAEKGALIYFEPCGTGDEKLFRQMCKLCHILKYSQQRARTFVDVLKGAEPLLQIETLGDDGIRFRSMLPAAWTDGWVKVDGLEVDQFKDAAGAGDWASAALIDFLGRSALPMFEKTSQRQLLRAVQYAQVLASWNCKYEGARGGMYESTWRSLQRYVRAASLKTKPLITRSEKMNAVATEFDICISCSPNLDGAAGPSSGASGKRYEHERNHAGTVA